jgi:N-carbamoylputrescine amidase
MKPLRIALAQLSAGPDRAANLARVLGVMGEAKRAGAGLIAFPEIILDRFFPQSRENREAAFALAEPIPGPTSDRIAERARELGLVTVFNLYEIDASGGTERRFDSSPVFDADGRLLGVTRMLHITDYEGFYEQTYYAPGDLGAPVYDTRVGKVGVAICYDRHYPEVMRALGVAGAELVVIPQAGTVGEWPEGLYEAEVRTAAFQNGYFVALANRAGLEGKLHFAGESFVVDPDGKVIIRSESPGEDLLLADVDLAACQISTARRLFWKHRRPEIYRGWDF